MLTLIDADIVAYRCAASAEAEPEEIALLRTDKLVRDILYLTNSTSYEMFLSGSNNFRKKVYPEYKANRKDKPKPVHLQACRDYLIKDWNAIVTEGCEADDMLGVYQLHDTANSCIASIDKDLLQIPGKHYNFVVNEWYTITLESGLKHFYEQLLKGDRTDNIPGVAGLGKVKASRLLDGCISELEMLEVCREQYKDDALLEVYGKCLWIWRKANDIWSMQKVLSSTGQNHSNSEEETKSESSCQMEEQDQSLVPTEMAATGYLVHGI